MYQRKTAIHIQLYIVRVVHLKHPTLYCKGCTLKPVNNYCKNFFEKNYFFYVKDKKDKFYKNIQVTDELRDVFGESDISD